MTKRYLGQVIKDNEDKFEGNSMIISPVGSGKTYFIFEDLYKEEAKDLLLVSTTSLKEAMDGEDNTYTSKSIRSAVEDKSGVHVMTYHEFGERIKMRDDFAKQFGNIYCDEIHSLFDYFSFSRDYKLYTVIRYLFNKQDNQDIYYFTATTDKISDFIKREEGADLMRDVEVYNYYNEDNIVGYSNMIKFEFSDTGGILDAIDHLEDFGSEGEKGIIFNERIDGMKKIEELVTAKGYNIISIWSINNKKHEMTDEQLRVRDELLKTGIIPEGYDFIIINGAMREGWNLVDENVELVILNTTDNTNIIQARGRVRSNISIIAQRVEGDKIPIETRLLRREKTLGVIESVLGKELTTADKGKLSDDLSVQRDNGRNIKWNAIKDILENNGYSVKDKRVVRDGKQVRVSVISKK